jgi:hypothetical protein
MHALNARFDADAGDALVEAAAINDLDQIVGNSANGRVFLLTPVGVRWPAPRDARQGAESNAGTTVYWGHNALPGPPGPTLVVIATYQEY